MTQADGPPFLDLLQIIQIHQDQIERYGGSLGLRDLDLLKSAVAMPSIGFGDHLAHPDTFSQAAAYLFHLAKNHPFIDGNKRVAAASALVFLRLQGWRVECSADELVELVLATISGQHDKAAIAIQLKSWSCRVT
ncbi:type II toxin-antitoxin system death-on-curing family toxin [bacterium]|nr:type II toxin-antitoxin system death-on-curing family toxin [bacterium]